MQPIRAAPVELVSLECVRKLQPEALEDSGADAPGVAVGCTPGVVATGAGVPVEVGAGSVPGVTVGVGGTGSVPGGVTTGGVVGSGCGS
jgi:hypothetical protein